MGVLFRHTVPDFLFLEGTIIGLLELFLIAVGLSMDAFAVSVCKGLSTQTLQRRHYLIVDATGITDALSAGTVGSIDASGVFGGLTSVITSPIMALFLIIMMGYAIVKCFFSNLKRGGILLIQIAVGSLYMFSIPRGYTDGFIQWCKQIIGLCLTTFLQATILTAGLLVLKDHALLGLGLMLSAGEVPRICGAFGLDTSTRANIMSAVYAAQTAINTTRTVIQTVAAK